MRPITKFAAVCILAVSALASAYPAQAENSKYAGYVIDVKSGKVLYSSNANSLRYPASLTKMMTLYMLFEEIEAGKLSLNSRLSVSKHASAQAPSKLNLKPGSSISVKDAILALVTKSANDVAVVVAENIGGTESQFARMMTQKARSIGMKRSTFKNASGLPNSGQRTTAADMALLGRALKDRYPSYFRYFSTRVFSYGKARYGNHNKLLGRVKGVDGIKTGYTRASGFNLVTNVETNGRHIVAVVMGGRTGASRDAEMRNLIKKYLPKAKSGARMTALVGVPAKRSYIQLAETVPLPRFKTLDTASEVNLVAETEALPKAAAVQLAVLPKSGDTDASPLREAIATDLQSVPAPRPRLTTAMLAIPPLPRAANDPIGDMSTHSAPLPEEGPKAKTIPSGWQIQLSATPTLASANDILENARSQNKKLLSARVNHTEAVEKGNTTLYRARFAGFPSKESARNACAVLKKQKFACLALNP
nr:D-alanyl-D-alanine carboxypeptidase [uncultured Cohaesibacter sp.]